MKKTVSFQGEIGSYSHLAIVQMFPDATVVPSQTFEHAMMSVENGEADIAMIPIENGVAGRVADVHRLLPKSNLYIIAEHFQRVEHTLLMHPNTTRNDLTKVASHEQALAQCTETIKKYGFKLIVSADTAGAAKMIADKNIYDTAVIASELAAEIYNLQIIEKNISDSKNNTTRFFVMSKKSADISPDKKKKYITSFMFSTKNVPGALFKVLKIFAENNINMINLESYNLSETFVVTDFYAEIEGAYTTIFKEINSFCDARVVGIYEQSMFRKNTITN